MNDRRTVFSPCGQFRYCLWREWTATNPTFAVFIGLNPSTADAYNDDPTVRRCLGYAKRWGYGALCMLNLFAYRATDPAVMKSFPSPIGFNNDYWICRLTGQASVVVAAWGVHGTHLHRDQAVMVLLAGKLSCLQTTLAGHPSHPLYLRANLLPRRFP